MRVDFHGEPIFIDVDKNPLNPNKPLVKRDAITALVRDPKTGTYLCLKWKNVDWDTFVTGGIDEGQTAEDAARMELLQETGYKHLRLVASLPPYCSLFFHSPKDENRDARWTSYLFELVDDERDPVSQEEQDKHDVVWLTREQMETFRLHEGQRFLWDFVLERGL